MFYITGDCHADFRRFNTTNFPQQYEMGRDDYVIVVGDIGLIWDGSRNDKHWIDWFSEKPFTLLFIDGNHDSHDLLSSMPVEEWHGGKTHKIAANIRHLMRGQVYNISGRTFFTFGGARSHDIRDGILDPEDPGFKAKRKALNDEGKIFYRIKGISWWDKEMPSDDEYAEGVRNLNAAGWKVDFILTHAAPTSTLVLMDHGSHMYEPDKLTDYLEDIRQRCDYKRWYFGHYHKDEAINNKDICLYERVIQIL